MVLGNELVGKTTLIQALRTEEPPSESDALFSVAKVGSQTVQLWDCYGSGHVRIPLRGNLAYLFSTSISYIISGLFLTIDQVLIHVFICKIFRVDISGATHALKPQHVFRGCPCVHCCVLRHRHGVVQIDWPMVLHNQARTARSSQALCGRVYRGHEI